MTGRERACGAVNSGSRNFWDYIEKQESTRSQTLHIKPANVLIKAEHDAIKSFGVKAKREQKARSGGLGGGCSKWPSVCVRAREQSWIQKLKHGAYASPAAARTAWTAIKRAAFA